MREFSILLLFIFSFLSLQAQPPADLFPGENLVPNPGFEKLRKMLPEYDLDGSVAFKKSIDRWNSPTKSTPDLKYFTSEYYLDDDQPRTGKAMVSILTHNPRSKRSDTYREYLQAKLNEKLIEGEEYYVEFWTKRSCFSKIASNNLGVVVSPTPYINPNWNPMTYVTPLVNETKVINGKKREWIKISTTFIAQGGESFLLIGNFFNNEDTIFENAEDIETDATEQAYYLIDDIGLYQLNLKPEPTLADLEMEVGMVIQLENIYFDNAKWELLPASNTELNQLIELMNKYPTMKIAIHGHTDSNGSDRYNLNLSNNRASAVYDFLKENDIDISRIESEGFGEAKPIETNTTAEGRQMNRRVEFVVIAMEEANVSVEGSR